MFGVLSKKPVGHHSSKWSKRFCVIKDGFLLYYPESEKKLFEDSKAFNIHPKGVIPLGNCNVEEISLHGTSCGLLIQLPDHKTSICLAAEDEESKRTWFNAFKMATKITLENCQLGEAMIQSLHKQSLDLVREKQDYIEKYTKEVEDLGIEREQKKALEEFNLQLVDEKMRIEQTVKNIQAAHEEIKRELDESLLASEMLDNDRKQLLEDTTRLQLSLSDLFAERTSILNLLEEREYDTLTPVESDEKSSNLLKRLETIATRAQEHETNKADIEKRMVANEQLSKKVEAEKNELYMEATKMKQDIEKMVKEKDVFKQQLEDEMQARMELQNELKICKQALKRLEAQALVDPSINCTQIKADVQSLKVFFERCAMESKMEIEVSGTCKKHRISRRITTMRHTHSRSSPTKERK